jgi:DedD protein
MAESQDTEITLGTGKMLTLFFALVALCAVFFGMGFSLGKNSAQSMTTGDLLPATASPGGGRPSAVKSTGGSASSDRSSYQAAGQRAANAQPVTNETASDPSPNASPSDSKTTPPDPKAPPPWNGYYVQVAAVSKREDAEALVEALKKKQYSAFAANTSTDKLFHVQVGPFADIKDAEGTRAKLVSAGYNPILKK